MVALLASAMAVSCSGLRRNEPATRRPAQSRRSRKKIPRARRRQSFPREPESTARRTLLFLGTSLTAGLGLDPDSAYPQQIQRKIDAAGFRTRW